MQYEFVTSSLSWNISTMKAETLQVIFPNILLTSASSLKDQTGKYLF